MFLRLAFVPPLLLLLLNYYFSFFHPFSVPIKFHSCSTLSSSFNYTTSTFMSSYRSFSSFCITFFLLSTSSSTSISTSFYGATTPLQLPLPPSSLQLLPIPLLLLLLLFLLILIFLLLPLFHVTYISCPNGIYVFIQTSSFPSQR